MNFVPFLEPLLTQSQDDEDITLKNWRERVFSAILALGALIGLLQISITTYNIFQRRNFVLGGIYIAAYLWLLCIAVIRKIPYRIRTASLIVMLYAIGFLSSLETAQAGDGRIWFIAAPIIAAIFIRGRVGLVLSAFSFLAWLTLGMLFGNGILVYNHATIDLITQPDNFAAWLNSGMTSFLISLVVVSSVSAVLNNLFTTLKQSQSLMSELEEKSDQLERQTQTLQRRSSNLEVITTISRAVTAIRDPNQIVFQSARRIREDFDLLHVGIFTLDTDDDLLTLQASSGDFQDDTPIRGEQISAHETAFSQVITNKQAISRQTGPENPALPAPIQLAKTRAIAMLPMTVHQEILGVITLQSGIHSPFDQQTLNTLQILVDQIAVILANAQFFAEREALIESERRAYSELTRQAWQEFRETHREVGYRRDQKGLAAIDAADTGLEKSDSGSKSLPVRIRGQVIGYIDVQKPPGAGPWTPTETSFLTTVIERLETGLDTARLYEESNMRVQELAVLNDFSRRLAVTLSVDEVLNEAYKSVTQLIEADTFYITIIDAEKDVVQSALIVADGEFLEPRPASRGGLTDYLIETKEPLLIPDNVYEGVKALGIAVNPMNRGRFSKSWVGVPIMLGSEVLGTMVALDYETPRAYGQRHSNLLSAIANQTAIALANAQLYEQTQNRAERERLTHQLTDQLHRAANVDRLMQTVIDEVASVLGASSSFVQFATLEEAAENQDHGNPPVRATANQQDAPAEEMTE